MFLSHQRSCFDDQIQETKGDDCSSDDDNLCPSRSFKIPFNFWFSGARGTRGFSGEQGESGPRGNMGLSGIKGSGGRPGIRGLSGLRGIQGMKGEKGEKSEQGIQGMKGERGLKGDQGLKGLNGLNGDQGFKGDRGFKGDQGEKGDRGEKGFKGDPGIQGIKGDPGIQGMKGVKGDQGIQGIKGVKGDQGIQGIQGDQGIQGIQGDQGIQGIQGIQGPTGPVVLSFRWSHHNSNDSSLTANTWNGYLRSSQESQTFHIFNFAPGLFRANLLMYVESSPSLSDSALLTIDGISAANLNNLAGVVNELPLTLISSSSGISTTATQSTSYIKMENTGIVNELIHVTADITVDALYPVLLWRVTDVADNDVLVFYSLTISLAPP